MLNLFALTIAAISNLHEFKSAMVVGAGQRLMDEVIPGLELKEEYELLSIDRKTDGGFIYHVTLRDKKGIYIQAVMTFDTVIIVEK